MKTQNKKYQIKIKIKNGHLIVYSDTPNLQRSKCRKCGKTVYWVQTNFNKAIPVSKLNNGDLISHFTDCLYANKFRRKK